MTSPYEPTEDERRVIEWLRGEEHRYPRSDYAAWCTYFRNQFEQGHHRHD